MGGLILKSRKVGFFLGDRYAGGMKILRYLEGNAERVID